MVDDWLIPAWPVSPQVRACSTTRHGGVSVAPYRSLNVGDHVGDAPRAVVENRQRVRLALDLPDEPLWLQQVHGTAVHYHDGQTATAIQADASYADQSGRVCGVMTADCLPLLVCDREGTKVAAIHAGWRGLCGGIIEQTLAAMAIPPAQLLVWLGPAIGPQAFEVGDEVRQAFINQHAQAARAFRPHGPGHWLADLYLLARLRLAQLGVSGVYGGEWCTYQDEARFFSYRRDGRTGRMVSLIWLV